MVNEAEAAQIALRWHKEICALSLSDAVKAQGSSAQRSAVRSVQKATPAWGWQVEADAFAALVSFETGKLIQYNNNAIISERLSGRNRRRSQAIKNKAVAEEWARKYSQSLGFPAKAVREKFQFPREGQRPGEQSAAVIFTGWTLPAPGNHPYHWIQKRGGDYLFSRHPGASLDIDPLDATLFSVGQDWEFTFARPEARISEETATKKAVGIMQEYRRKYPRHIRQGQTRVVTNLRELKTLPPETAPILDTSIGPHRTELCYKARGAGRFQGTDFVPASLEETSKHPITMYLVWCVRFGPARDAVPQYDEVTIDALTGQPFDMYLGR